MAGESLGAGDVAGTTRFADSPLDPCHTPAMPSAPAPADSAFGTVPLLTHSDLGLGKPPLETKNGPEQSRKIVGFGSPCSGSRLPGPPLSPGRARVSCDAATPSGSGSAIRPELAD